MLGRRAVNRGSVCEKRRDLGQYHVGRDKRRTRGEARMKRTARGRDASDLASGGEASRRWAVGEGPGLRGTRGARWGSSGRCEGQAGESERGSRPGPGGRDGSGRRALSTATRTASAARSALRSQGTQADAGTAASGHAPRGRSPKAAALTKQVGAERRRGGCFERKPRRHWPPSGSTRPPRRSIVSSSSFLSRLTTATASTQERAF